MRIALFGATGFTGKAVLTTAIARGIEVKALVRQPGKVTTSSANLELVQGNALDIDGIRRVITDVDAVVHCLGVGGKGSGKPTTLVSDSVQLVIQAMEEAGPKRLVCMSNVGAGESGTFLVNKIIVPVFLRWLQPLIEDKDRMEAVLQKSKLDWVSVRLPNIVEGPAKPLRVGDSAGRGISWSITDHSVADFMLQQAMGEPPRARLPSVSN